MALTKLNVARALTGSVPAANGGGGKIGQVQYTKTQTTTTTNSTSFVDATNMTLNITPSATSSKILCIVNANKCLANASDLSAISYQIVRGSTAIYTSINYLYQTNDDQVNGTTTLQVVDEPNTTSETTYKLQIRNRESNNVVLNNGGDTDSSITLMEILA